MLRAAVAVFVFCFLICDIPASAHVKWFLQEGEADLMARPKPELFTHPTWENVLVIALGLIALHLSVVLARRWASWPLNRYLTAWSVKYESIVGLSMGIFTGLLMVLSARDYLFLVPNMPIDDRLPDWFATVQAAAGWGLVLGFFTRASAALLLAMLIGSFRTFPILDCLDLIPMYGIASYFLFAGRGRFSIDSLLGLARPAGITVLNWGYRLLRWSTGLGLVVLGLDEKLLHPQLALDVLAQAPTLNFMHFAGMPNDLFILCAGVVEVLVGLVILVGSFPRIGVLFLAGLFVCSTIIFGQEELIGHMPYYGVVIALVLRGNGGQEQPSFKLWFGRLVPALERLTIYRNP
jgi:uncharacterized membrane protein YphA (DoxX/SURF4 family)